MREPRFIEVPQSGAATPAEEAIAGLVARPARLAPKFFYDALGARLFDAITELDEYYLTRTEAALLAAHQGAIGALVQRALGPGRPLVDLGAGNCAKAAGLFGVLQPGRYVAVDIAAEFLRGALGALQPRFPTLEMVGVGLDFSSRLALPSGLVAGPALVFYPGSSIGNFNAEQALRLLREMHALAAGGALLIGVDLAKAASVLEPAYNDALGVTAAFNLNVLRHLNRLIGSDFNLRDWRHLAYYHRGAMRIEMHLEARHGLVVQWPGGERRFDSGDRIHTEDSFKWERADFEEMLREAGFRRVQTWTDERGWFAVMLAEAG
jgi:dimethylhistidine N-methyltransferase